MSEESFGDKRKKFQKIAGEKTEVLSKKAGAKIKEVISFFSQAPEKRAIASGRYLARLSLSWGILSIIGSIIVMLQTTCVDESDYGICYETSHPYVNWAIVSLLANLIVSSFTYTVGTYIEARMGKELARD